MHCQEIHFNEETNQRTFTIYVLFIIDKEKLDSKKNSESVLCESQGRAIAPEIVSKIDNMAN